MNWYLAVLRKYADFNGRARRSEYWYFTLFTLIAVVVLALVGALLDMVTGTTQTAMWINALVGLYWLAVLLPSLGVTVRRLHDTGRSGWWIFIAFVPFVGGIILLIFECLDSVGDNQYGPNPKGSALSGVPVS
jgi:uncharacterized membrane protein YhaH (DUF805 family)